MNRGRSRRGVAMVLALLTTVVLVVLSMAFMGLSMGEARSSRAYGLEEVSRQAAAYGMEWAIAYMGNGSDSNNFKIWNDPAWPNPTGDPALNFGFYNVLNPTPFLHVSGCSFAVTSAATDPGLAAYLDPLLPAASRPQALADLRRIRLVSDAPGHPDLPFPIGTDLAFTANIVVEPLLLDRNQGRHDFRLVTTARVYSRLPDGGVASGAPLASRVVEARVKESSFDYAHFISNGRTWNPQGTGLDSLATVPDPNHEGRTVSLSDYVMIPRTYTETGPMRIDGQDTSLLTNPTTSQSMKNVVEASGNLRFQSGLAQGHLRFTHPLTINQASNLYQDPDVVDTSNPGLTGGFTPSAARVGVPDFRVEDMKAAAQLRPADHYKSGYFKVETSEIPGALGSTAAAPRGNDPTYGPFYSGTETRVIGGVSQQVLKPFDYRPRIPTVEITLNGDKVEVARRSTLTGQQVGPTQTIANSDLAMGLLYVEGGNAVVRTAREGESNTPYYQGRLSVGAGELAARNVASPTASASADTIYATAAREYYELLKNRWDNESKVRRIPVSEYADFPTPPYSVAQLRQALRDGEISTALPAGLANNQQLWPSPASEMHDGAPRFTVEREGNIVISDDVKAGKTAGNALGLFAQNFVLLNDTTPSNQITVDAVIMSKERSFSLDWDNSGFQNPTTWAAMMSTVDAAGNAMARTLNLHGSVVGEYIDVEGDALGRGYIKQNFEYDAALRTGNPPMMPRLNLSATSGGYRYMVIHFRDRGALSTDSSLGG